MRGVYESLPGGMEAMPGVTTVVIGVVDWVGRWWPLCLALGVAVIFGTPVLCGRFERGRRFLLSATSG